MGKTNREKWITAYRCGFCKHIYYNKEFRFDKICPKCGHKNYLDNPWPGDHLEYVLIRKRLFHGWEVKEVDPNMQRNCRIKYISPKFESDLLKLTSDDEPKILELCKDYLAGTWIVVEISKDATTKYNVIKTLDEKVVNGFYITTYTTDKKEPISGMRFRPYFNAADILKGRKCWTNEEIVSKDYEFSEEKVTAYSPLGEPIFSIKNISKITEKRQICDNGKIYTIYQEILPGGTVKTWLEE